MNITELAKQAEATALKLMPFLGVNKQREISRLIFEIAKRDKISAEEVLPQKQAKNFEQAKNYLLQKRYPKTFGKVPQSAYYLPKLDLEYLPDAKTETAQFNPKYIYVEKEVQNSPLALRVKAMFPAAQYTVLDKKTFVDSQNYSDRKETLVIIKENFDFVKPCPCTKGCFCCGYNLVNLGFGCCYECAYCFLQQYQNLHAIVLPANIEDFLAQIAKTAPLRKGSFDYTRIGSGEFTDSLLFDHITNYSKDIVEFFRGRPEIFEFKTKSINVDNLLKLAPAPNIAVGWSVNPQNIIDTCEFLTPPLEERLKAAARVAAHGFKTAFHFDPVILHEGWQQNYAQVVEKIAATVPPQSVLWVSIGTLRFNRELKKFMETRFKETTLLDEEFTLDFDGKLRYPQEERKKVYDFLAPLIKAKLPDAKVYLCMETAENQI